MIIPPWAYLAGGALALAASFGAGWQVRSWKADSDALEAVTAAQVAVDLQRQAWDAAAMWMEGARAALDRQSFETRTLIEREYRHVEVPAGCAVPAAVADSLRASVETANRAAAGVDPGAVP